MSDTESPRPVTGNPETAAANEPPPILIGHSLRGIALCAGLFVLTCVSTFFNGMFYGERTPETTDRDLLWYGLSYAGPLMLILTAHELGHYLMARWYRVPATLPIFIPLPPGVGLFGTMGAVIVQAAGFAHRKATFDIGIAGPLAGLVFALPVAWLGIQQSRVIEFSPDVPSTTYGDPLILKAMVWLTFGPLPPNHDVVLNPLLYAGWVGVFLTGLNLIPIGQLDGGHIVYTLLGRRAHQFSFVVLAAGAAYMAYFNYWAYAPMLVLLAMIGVRHPPTTDDHMPLGVGRYLLGWFTIGVLLVTCFTPFPLTFNEAKVPPSQMQPLPPEEGDLMVKSISARRQLADENQCDGQRYGDWPTDDSFEPRPIMAQSFRPSELRWFVDHFGPVREQNLFDRTLLAGFISQNRTLHGPEIRVTPVFRPIHIRSAFAENSDRIDRVPRAGIAKRGFIVLVAALDVSAGIKQQIDQPHIIGRCGINQHGIVSGCAEVGMHPLPHKPLDDVVPTAPGGVIHQGDALFKPSHEGRLLPQPAKEWSPDTAVNH